MFNILDRGTHRSLFLSHTKSDVPIFIQYPKLNAEKIDFIWEVNLGSHLSNIVMRVDMDNKKLKFSSKPNNVNEFFGLKYLG